MGPFCAVPSKTYNQTTEDLAIDDTMNESLTTSWPVDYILTTARLNASKTRLSVAQWCLPGDQKVLGLKPRLLAHLVI